MMIILCHSSADPIDLAVATAYWSRSPGNGWTQKVREIEEELALRRSTAQKLTSAAAVAYLPELRCAECALPIQVISRPDYEDVVRTLHDRSGRRKRRFCSVCASAALEATIRSREEAEANRKRDVERWLGDQRGRRSNKSVRTICPRALCPMLIAVCSNYNRPTSIEMSYSVLRERSSR